LRSTLAAVGLAWEDVANLVHSTTLITNAIVEDRLAPVALVATAVLSLCSDDSGNITERELAVDGGWYVYKIPCRGALS